MSANLDWIYHFAGWALAAVGLALLLWSLFWDRGRGRRRCPKCWYDMSGVPGLMCPECGHEAAREDRLFRARRRPMMGGIATAVAVLGAMTGHLGKPGPSWKGAIPTPLLARIAPLSDQFLCTSWLDIELARRLKNPTAPSYSLTTALNRLFAAHPAELADTVVTRSHWPEGVPISAVVSQHLYSIFDVSNDYATRARLLSTADGRPGAWIDSSYHGSWDKPLGLAKAGNAIDLEVEFVRGDVRLWSGRLQLPGKVGGTIGDLLTAADAPDLDQKIARWMSPRLMMWGSGPALYIEDRTRDYMIGKDVAMGVLIDVCRGQQVVATGTHHWSRNWGGGCGLEPTGTWVKLNWNEPPPRGPTLEGRWSVRIRGDATLALLDFHTFAANQVDKTRFWAGAFERDLSNMDISR